jgi:hypothetical protein
MVLYGSTESFQISAGGLPFTALLGVGPASDFDLYRRVVNTKESLSRRTGQAIG